MHKEKTGMNILSCATTFSFLVVLSCVYATLSLPLAVLGGVIDAGAWAIITALSVKTDHNYSSDLTKGIIRMQRVQTYCVNRRLI
jgi:hypothetical protein